MANAGKESKNGI